MRRAAALLAIVLVTATACTFDYEEGTVEATGHDALPQVDIRDVRMVVVRENRLVLTADRIASYPDEGIQEFDAVVFREFGPDGELRLEGSADRAVLSVDTENIELSGSVRIVSTVEDGSVTSDFLYWEDDARVLSSGTDGTVRLEREDGTRVEGGELYVDGRRNVIEFRNGVSGVYQTDQTEYREDVE